MVFINESSMVKWYVVIAFIARLSNVTVDIHAQ
jgi:hypothetical protein